jgi:hypothetical protein
VIRASRPLISLSTDMLGGGVCVVSVPVCEDSYDRHCLVVMPFGA